MTPMYTRDQCRAAFMAIMIGDAMGQPVETMTAPEILAATNGRGVTGFIDPIQTRIKQNRQLKAGDTTDDWQLTAVMARSLSSQGGFNIFNIAYAHVEAATNPIGWGSTTLRAVRELDVWFQTGAKEGRSPIVPAPSFGSSKGAGNGVAMKVMPLVLWHGLRSYQRHQSYQEIKQLGQLTHSASEAYRAAFLLGRTMSMMATQPPRLIVQHLYQDAIRYFDPEDASSERLRASVEALRDNVGNMRALEERITPGFMASESVIYAIGVALSMPDDYRGAVLTAVNAGLDSDSTAAIAGMLVALRTGTVGIPEEWIGFRPEFAQAYEMADQLYAAAMGA